MTDEEITSQGLGLNQRTGFDATSIANLRHPDLRSETGVVREMR